MTVNELIKYLTTQPKGATVVLCSPSGSPDGPEPLRECDFLFRRDTSRKKVKVDSLEIQCPYFEQYPDTEDL